MRLGNLFVIAALLFPTDVRRAAIGTVSHSFAFQSETLSPARVFYLAFDLLRPSPEQAHVFAGIGEHLLSGRFIQGSEGRRGDEESMETSALLRAVQANENAGRAIEILLERPPTRRAMEIIDQARGIEYEDFATILACRYLLRADLASLYPTHSVQLASYRRGAVNTLALQTVAISPQVVYGARAALYAAGIEAIPYLLELHSRPFVFEAILAIGPSAIPVMKNYIQDKKPENRDARVLALETLGQFGEKARSALPAIIDCLSAEEEPQVRTAALIALGGFDRLEDQTVLLPKIIAALPDADKNNYPAALQVLKKMGDPAVDALLTARSAVSSPALAAIGFSALPALIEALDNPSLEVHERTLASLDKIASQNPDAITMLIYACCKAKTLSRRDGILKVLIKLEKTKGSLIEVIKKITSSDRPLLMGLLGIEHFEHIPNGIEASLRDELAKSTDPEIIAAILLAIGRSERPLAQIDELRSYLNHEDKRVVLAAALALNEFQTKGESFYQALSEDALPTFLIREFVRQVLRRNVDFPLTKINDSLGEHPALFRASHLYHAWYSKVSTPFRELGSYELIQRLFYQAIQEWPLMTDEEVTRYIDSLVPLLATIEQEEANRGVLFGNEIHRVVQTDAYAGGGRERLRRIDDEHEVWRAIAMDIVFLMIGKRHEMQAIDDGKFSQSRMVDLRTLPTRRTASKLNAELRRTDRVIQAVLAPALAPSAQGILANVATFVHYTVTLDGDVPVSFLIDLLNVLFFTEGPADFQLAPLGRERAETTISDTNWPSYLYLGESINRDGKHISAEKRQINMTLHPFEYQTKKGRQALYPRDIWCLDLFLSALGFAETRKIAEEFIAMLSQAPHGIPTLDRAAVELYEQNARGDSHAMRDPSFTRAQALFHRYWNVDNTPKSGESIGWKRNLQIVVDYYAGELATFFEVSPLVRVVYGALDGSEERSIMQRLHTAREFFEGRLSVEELHLSKAPHRPIRLLSAEHSLSRPPHVALRASA